MERVYSYAVYLAESAAGDQRSQIGNQARPGMFSEACGVGMPIGTVEIADIMCC